MWKILLSFSAVSHNSYLYPLMRVILFFLILFFAFSGRAGHLLSPTSINDSLIDFSKKQLGVKYKWAMSSPQKGFDCSGFVYYVFSHFNIKVPRSSKEFEKAGKIISPDSCRPGDIVVFTGTNSKIRRAGHVGIILSEPGEDITFIHSSSSQKKSGVKISSFSGSPAYKKRFICIVRIPGTDEINFQQKKPPLKEEAL